jgi:hypothetical protein
MRLEDTNHDLKLDVNDAHFKDLRVWVDANQDGKTDSGELKTLDELGIVSLDLGAMVGTHVDNGNLLGLVSSYTTKDGASHDMADVWFAKGAETVKIDDLLAAPAAELANGLTSAAVVHTTTNATSADTGAAVNRSLLDDDTNKPLPLI